MKKYDCSKTADFAHEAKRMCEHYVEKTGQCIKCPLYTTECDIDKITDRVIDVVQIWSDEHPEIDTIRKFWFCPFPDENTMPDIVINLALWHEDVGKAYDRLIKAAGKYSFKTKYECSKLASWLIDIKFEQRSLKL